MKKDFTTMISVVVCVLLVVNLIQIHHLKQDVTDLRAETRNELRAVSNSISSNAMTVTLKKVQTLAERYSRREKQNTAKCIYCKITIWRHN